MDIGALISQLSDAVAAKNWLVVVVIAVIVLAALVAAVLRIFKKDAAAAVVDKVESVGETVLPMLPKNKVVDPASQAGVAGVVPVTEEKKGPNP